MVHKKGRFSRNLILDGSFYWFMYGPLKHLGHMKDPNMNHTNQDGP